MKLALGGEPGPKLLEPTIIILSENVNNFKTGNLLKEFVSVF